MTINDWQQAEGRTYPARRRTRNIVGGVSEIQATSFSMGVVELEPKGGQVPWHNQEQEEIYCVIEGSGEMCLGQEKQQVSSGPNGLYSLRHFSSTDQYRRHGFKDDLRLRPGG